MNVELEVGDKVIFPDGETGIVFSAGWKGYQVVLDKAQNGYREFVNLDSNGLFHGVKVCEKFRPEVTEAPATWVGKLVMVRDGNSEDWKGPYRLNRYDPESDFPFFTPDEPFRYAKLAEEQE